MSSSKKSTLKERKELEKSKIETCQMLLDFAKEQLEEAQKKVNHKKIKKPTKFECDHI